MRIGRTRGLFGTAAKFAQGSLAWDATWIETLRPAATGTGAEFFGDATLVYTQTGPASVRSPLLPGSNGSEAYLRVTNDTVDLLGFHGGSDAGQLGVGAFVKPTSACTGDPNCTPDLRTVFMTRYSPLNLGWAPKNLFDVRQYAANAIEESPSTYIPGLSDVLPTFTALRIRAAETSVTSVNAFGTLLLPGGSFEVLREVKRSFVELRLEANMPPLGWLDITDIAIQYDISPGVHWGTWEQYTHRYFDAVSKESLATTYSPIALYGQADSNAIEQVRFKNLAAVPEPRTAPLLLAGLIALHRLARMRACPPLGRRCRDRARAQAAQGARTRSDQRGRGGLRRERDSGQDELRADDLVEKGRLGLVAKMVGPGWAPRRAS